jgi:hypothetical protein
MQQNMSIQPTLPLFVIPPNAPVYGESLPPDASVEQRIAYYEGALATCIRNAFTFSNPQDYLHYYLWPIVKSAVQQDYDVDVHSRGVSMRIEEGFVDISSAQFHELARVEMADMEQ